MRRQESPDRERDTLALSYLGLRRAVGVIGVTLPFALVAGKSILDGPGLEASLSDYYYTGVRDVFVGALCAIAVFLFCYRYGRADTIAGRLGGIFAVGVALFPTTHGAAAGGRLNGVGVVHTVCAAGFFLTLVWFCLVLFPRAVPGVPRTRRKRQRNAVYRTCGVLIMLALVLAGAVLFVPGVDLGTLKPIFWLESLADFSFGVAWFVKGGAILRDVEPR